MLSTICSFGKTKIIFLIFFYKTDCKNDSGAARSITKLGKGYFANFWEVRSSTFHVQVANFPPIGAQRTILFTFNNHRYTSIVIMQNSNNLTTKMLKQSIRWSQLRFREATRSFTSHVPSLHKSLLTRNIPSLIQVYHLQGMNIQWMSYTTATPKSGRTKDEVASQVIEDMVRQASTKATQGGGPSATTVVNPSDTSKPFHANPNAHPNTRADGSHITSSEDVMHSKAGDSVTQKMGKFADIVAAAARLSAPAAVEKPKSS